MLFGLDGAAAGEIKLPGAGSLAGISGRQDSSLLFYALHVAALSGDHLLATT